MHIPKMDFWKLTKVSFVDFCCGSAKGARLSLALIDEVLTAIEKLNLAPEEQTVEPEDPAAWKEWNDTYLALYASLKEIKSALNWVELRCRQNNEMLAACEKLQERFRRLREVYGGQDTRY